MMKRLALGAMVAATLACAGCRSMQVALLGKMGYAKRDLLVDSVKDARDSQASAQQQFKDALTQFGSVVNYDGGDLEKKYKEMEATLKRSEARAAEVHDRILDVEAAANALFGEWKKELSRYSSDALRKDSEQKLKQTRARYETLLASMKQAEKTIEPVLRPLRDQVLYLKHNLNARALAAIKDELTRVQTDVSSLVREMSRAIAEADQFIQALQKE